MSDEKPANIRVRIIGDGTTRGTKVLNAATGEPIKGIRRISYDQEAWGPTIVKLTMICLLDELNIEAGIEDLENESTLTVREDIFCAKLRASLAESAAQNSD